MTRQTRPLTLKLLATAVALMLTGAIWSGGTWSAFNISAASPGDSVATGSVSVFDNDGGSPLFTLTGATNGTTATSCEVITYSGSVPANMRLYAAVGGSGLAEYLTLTITRGTITGTPAAKSCTGFTADGTNYVGSGTGVIYSGGLTSFPGTLGTALVDPLAGAPETWANGEAHAYQLKITMNSASGAGKNATASFSFAANSQ